MTASTSHPPLDPDPESVHRVYLQADIQPAIRAATHEQLRDVVHRVSKHLCHHLGRDIGAFPAIGPNRRRPWEICQIGAAMPAGFQLYHHLTAAVAGSYLQAMGFAPASAATDPAYHAGIVAPFVATARHPHLLRMLLKLASHMSAVLADSDTSAQASSDALAEVPGDVWEIGAGVDAAIGLYRYCARVMSVHVRYCICEGLGIGDLPHYRPYTPEPADTRPWTTTTTLN